VRPAGCRVAPILGSGCSSERSEPRPETMPRLARRVLAPPGLALIAIQPLRKLRLRRRSGLGVARTRRQPAQLYPMQQPVGARRTAINLKLLLQYPLHVDPTKRHHPVPLQLGASDNPFLQPRPRHGVDPWLSTRARAVTQSLNAVLFGRTKPASNGTTSPQASRSRTPSFESFNGRRRAARSRPAAKKRG
jgi:hypothetical protein